MLIDQWLGLYLSIITLYSLYILIPAAFRFKSLMLSLFSISALSFFVSSIIVIFELEGREWANLSSIIFTLCGLFAFIRDSKPIFARFPTYFSFLPLISFVFYPIIMNSQVIENLVIATYQGGAIIVGLLIASLHQIKNKSRFLLFIGMVLFLISYLVFWFINGYESISRLMVGVSIIITSLGLIQTFNKNFK
tara:strand:- start:2897 stop:3475 length:579 start_codon:yes stop_codon:yes gene_type:complete